MARYAYIDIYVYIYTHVCMYIYIYTDTCIHTYIHTCMHVYMTHAYIPFCFPYTFQLCCLLTHILWSLPPLVSAHTSKNNSHVHCPPQVSLAVSPTHVYVGLRSSRGIAVFARNAQTGLLIVQEAKGYWTPFAEANAWGKPTNMSASSFPLLGLSAMVLSSDARTLYAVSMLDDTLVVLDVATSGEITSLRQVIKDGAGFAGRSVDGLGGAAGLTLTSDSVYVTGWGDKAVCVFTKDSSGSVTKFVDRIKGGERLFDSFPQHDIVYDELIQDGNMDVNDTAYDVSMRV
jgi:hypothetical protein